MSFSFNVRAPSADEAKRLVVLKMDEVVSSQPVHAQDRRLAEVTAGALAEFVKLEEGQELSVSVSGSLGWRGHDVEANFSSANLNVQVSAVTST
jgi:hypothetical protein